MQGRRIYNTKDDYQPGDYFKVLHIDEGLPDNAYCNQWRFMTPNGIRGRINDLTWQIIEHEDGTITVSPSIFVKSPPLRWHGYLSHGVWEKF